MPLVAVVEHVVKDAVAARRGPWVKKNSRPRFLVEGEKRLGLRPKKTIGGKR